LGFGRVPARNLAYSEPKADVRVNDDARLEAGRSNRVESRSAHKRVLVGEARQHARRRATLLRMIA
jgi:hypothetical protein